MSLQLSLIGFGEAGESFADGANWGAGVRGFDILPQRGRAMACHGVRACKDAAQALEGADIVLSLVTADTALAAARDYAAYLKPGAYWCDLNSVAPHTKRAAAEAIEASGGRYADVAVMAPVRPARRAVPLLTSGPWAAETCDILTLIGFSACRIVGDDIGRASTIKLCRSIAIKGMEALCDELLEACGAAGVTDEVLTSLDASKVTLGWAERCAHSRERMAQHGLRRAAEMQEAAQMLSGLDVDAVMTQGTIARQKRAAS